MAYTGGRYTQRAENKIQKAPMTTLRDFVSEALVQFLAGIQAAQRDPNVGPLVAPSQFGPAKLDPTEGVAFHQGHMLTVMKFDVAVTADSSSKDVGGANVKAGLSVMNIGLSSKLEASGEQSQRFENVSRVKFAVHVQLPVPPGTGAPK